jgi:hypothetical protein
MTSGKSDHNLVAAREIAVLAAAGCGPCPRGQMRCQPEAARAAPQITVVVEFPGAGRGRHQGG